MMQALRQITLADALSYAWTMFWRTFVWVVGLMLIASLLDVEWSNGVFWLCVASAILDSVLSPR